MEFTFDMVFRTVQIFVCHSFALAIITVPRYRRWINRLYWGGLAIIASAFSLGAVKIFPESGYALSYIVTMGMYIVAYIVLSSDVLSRKILIFSAYANFYSITWTMARLISIQFFEGTMFSLSVVAMVIYLIFALLFGKKINDGLCRIHYESEKQQAEKFRAQIYENRIRELREIEMEDRRNRHDIHHHNMVLANLIEKGKIQAALTYLDAYEKDAQEHAMMRYCENETANVLIGIYAKKAKTEHIIFTSHVVWSDSSVLKPTDITILLSNILENAFHGCINAQKPNREISVITHYNNDKLVILCSNTCRDDIEFQQDGLPLNPNRMGIGTRSIQAITNRYDGHVDFHTKEGKFICQLFLKDIFS